MWYNGTMLKLVKQNLRKKRYKSYLKSPRWKAKRKRVLARDGFKCVRCGNKYNLQVHHLTYKRIFKERLSDLITLCQSCHKKEHGR